MNRCFWHMHSPIIVSVTGIHGGEQCCVTDVVRPILRKSALFPKIDYRLKKVRKNGFDLKLVYFIECNISCLLIPLEFIEPICNR